MFTNIAEGYPSGKPALARITGTLKRLAPDAILVALYGAFTI
jgi:hypothetical protein